MESRSIVKKYQVSLVGALSFMLVSSVSMASFANVEVDDDKIAEVGIDGICQINADAMLTEMLYLNEDNKTTTIDDKEYEKLIIGENQLEPYLIDIDGSDSIDGFGSKLYAFDMSAWGEKYHNGFVVRFSNMICKNGVDYDVIIQENKKYN